jgi:AraC-like DNA-binding protein
MPEFLYTPTSDGMARTASGVHYAESAPPATLAQLVHCFWELRTESPLADDFLYHALPDACVNLLLDQRDPRIAGVTALRTRAEVLNLGRAFHYVGVQLYPGVWRGDPAEIHDRYVGTPYLGALPLVRTSERIRGLPFAAQQEHLAELVAWCVAQQLIAPHAVIARILSQLPRLRSVADMAALVGLSPRQLQRTVRAATTLSPHDLLKVLRLQQSFRRHHLDVFADQSQYIHAFRDATGFTPVRYRARFDVRFSQDTDPPSG